LKHRDRRRAAVFAALLASAGLAAPPAGLSQTAEDVALIAREGGIALTGTLIGFDGEFFRISTAYGPLTVDAEGVICDGPACPDLTAPRARLRLTGAADAGRDLLPGLVAAFAAARGLRLVPADGAEYAARLDDPLSGQTLADLSFGPAPPAEALEALRSGAADLVLASRVERPFGSRTLALDALVPIVAPGNPLPEISTAGLAAILSGEARNWAEVGGPDMPVVLHALDPGADLSRALADRLGQEIAADVRHADLAGLAAAVAADPWAVAVTGRAQVGPARALPLTDSCGFPLLPTPLAVKAEDYPLALPLHLLTPPRRLPLMAREFLDFLSSEAAQEVIARAGYVDRGAERQPMTADGLRLINAIQGAGEEVTLADLKRVANLMDGAERLSLTFRFEDGAADLDPASRQNLADLAQALAAGGYRGREVILAGFSDGSGAAAANLALSEERAARVRADLAALAPDLPEAALPRVEAFGEALPMACDDTAAGRRLNRRVEVWLRPAFTPAE
jgi:phosphate transport system substrate-binding protein